MSCHRMPQVRSSVRPTPRIYVHTATCVLDTAMMSFSSSYLCEYFHEKRRQNGDCRICHEDIQCPDSRPPVFSNSILHRNSGDVDEPNRGECVFESQDLENVSPQSFHLRDCGCTEIKCHNCYPELIPPYTPDPPQTDLTFCTSCGMTFHLSCVEKWRLLTLNIAAGDRCALCRQPWGPPLSTVFPALEAKALQIYFEFISHGAGRVCGPGNEILTILIRCYETGFCFLNRSFCNSVLSAVFTACNELHDVPCPEEIRLVYDMPSGFRAMRRLFVNIWVQWSRNGLQYLREEGDEIPDAFILDLARVAGSGSQRKWFTNPVAGKLQRRRTSQGIVQALDKDFEKTADRNSALEDEYVTSEEESREVHTLTINMAGEVMTPAALQDAGPSGRDGAG
ncbi:hypothetical protein EJ07DRAFT_158350 [Lizonia empirigonia]|nr:hypothetical protein EJ07DRAFT_158350 [Lizonia empirigonia]